MKSVIIVFFIVILFVQVGYAQDSIFFRNKTTVNAKITGLSERNISYKKYENQQGILYTTPISKIDSVKWESGEISIYPLLHPGIKKKGYEIALELAMREQFEKEPLSVFDQYFKPVVSSCIVVSQMYRFNPYIAVGGVIGLDYSYWYEPFVLDNIPSYLYYEAVQLKKVQALNLPLLVRIKVDFIKRKISPYFLLDCGYSFPIAYSTFDLYKQNGLEINAAIGFDVRFDNNAAVYFHLGYYYHLNKNIDSFIWDSFANNDIHSFSFNVGYKF